VADTLQVLQKVAKAKGQCDSKVHETIQEEFGVSLPTPFGTEGQVKTVLKRTVK